MEFVLESPFDHDGPPSPPSYPAWDPKTLAPRYLPEPPTVLARRYGMSRHPMLRNTGKSGITPIVPPDLNRIPPISPTGLRRAEAHEELQRRLLLDFATWELVDSGCWMSDNAKAPDLDAVPVHALYQQGQWIDGNIPVGMGFSGVWEGKNPVVWDAILPSLKLATLLLRASPLSPWLDALMRGPRKEVPSTEMASLPIPDGSSDYSFHARPREEFIKDVDSQLTWFDDLLPRMRIGIASSKTSSDCHLIPNRLPIKMGGTAASATTQPVVDSLTHDASDHQGALQAIFTAVHLEVLQPLLRTDLTASERLAQQCYLGILFVHETMHAIGIWKRAMSSVPVFNEPFFEDEAIAELGYSWEKAMFTHGRISTLFDSGDRESHPALGLMIASWPQWYNFVLADPQGIYAVRRRREELYDIGSTTTAWPFHISFIENLVQYKYWTTFVQKFGLLALQPPRVTGRRWIMTETERGSDNLTVYGPDYHAWVASAEPNIPVTADETARWEAEQMVQLRASVMTTALRRQKMDEETHQRDLQLVQEWEIRRQAHPLPLVLPADVDDARLRIVLRRAEVEETQAAVASQHLTPADIARSDAEARDWRNLAKEMLEDAINYYEQGDTVNSFEHCVGVLRIMREKSPEERFLMARAHTILGILGVMRSRDHLHAAIDTYRSFEAMQIPGIDGRWREWIFEAQEVLEQLNQRQVQSVGERLALEQEKIDAALRAVWINDQERAAGICSKLLGSQFTSIRAQAHLIISRLDKTPDKIPHAKAALARLQRLNEEAPGQRDWGSMMKAVVWVLHPPPPWIAMNEMDDAAQQDWVIHAQQLSLAGDERDGPEVLKIFLTFSASAYITIRAQCHLHLSRMRLAGDELFRRQAAFHALADLERLRFRDPYNTTWPELLVQVQGILGGATRAEWEAVVLADALSMEQIVRTTSRLTM